MAAFEPHGPIRTPLQQQLYFKAHIGNIYAGISDPKEPETVALMEAILNQNIFTDPHFVVNSQQPPNPTSARRCDLVVRYLATGGVNIKTLIFAECKRTSSSQAFSLESLEKQASAYCNLYLDYENVGFVYAITAAGTHARFWKCSRGSDGWVPLWGAKHPGDWGQYKDVGDDAAGSVLSSWFERMKQAPPSLYAGQSLETYATSYQASPPSASASGFQVAPSGYQTEPSAISFSAAGKLPSNAPTGQYMYPIQATQTNSSAQRGQSSNEPLGEENEEHEGEDQYGEEDEGDDDMGEEYQAAKDVSAQQAASSSAGSKYYIVRVTKKTHTFESDDFIFKDSKGKRRLTKRKDWHKTTFQGQSAMQYHHYISYDISTFT